MLALRSLAYQIAFYLGTTIMVLLSLPAVPFLGERGMMWIVRTWGQTMTWFLRVIAGTRLEVRGLEHMPKAGCIVAPKHQSMFETFAIIPLLPNPTMVMKEQIASIPVFGWYTRKAGMIALDRAGAAKALRGLAASAGEAVANDRQVVIFPEGTRRPVGAPPAYQTGIGLVYRKLGVPVVPVALNTGLFWERHGFYRRPGTIIFEFLPAIEPGMEPHAFVEELENRIETASNALIPAEDTT